MLSFSKYLCHLESGDVLPSSSNLSSTAAFCASAPSSPCIEALFAGFAGGDTDPRGGLGAGALPHVRTFCEAVLYECLALEKAEVLPAYLRLYHLAANLTQASHSLPVHSVRVLAAYYASPALSRMHAGFLTGGAASEPLLQPTFVHSLCAQLDMLFSSLAFDAQMGRRTAAVAAAFQDGASLEASGGTRLFETQRRILFGAFLAHNGIRTSNCIAVSSAAGGELLPFMLATVMSAKDGDPRGTHATALRIAALGASNGPWSSP